jgi:hypothetical protein
MLSLVAWRQLQATQLDVPMRSSCSCDLTGLTSTQ